MNAGLESDMPLPKKVVGCTSSCNYLSASYFSEPHQVRKLFISFTPHRLTKTHLVYISEERNSSQRHSPGRSTERFVTCATEHHPMPPVANQLRPRSGAMGVSRSADRAWTAQKPLPWRPRWFPWQWCFYSRAVIYKLSDFRGQRGEIRERGEIVWLGWLWGKLCVFY